MICHDAQQGIDQMCHFLQAQDLGQLPANLGIGQELAERSSPNVDRQARSCSVVIKGQ